MMDPYSTNFFGSHKTVAVFTAIVFLFTQIVPASFLISPAYAEDQLFLADSNRPAVNPTLAEENFQADVPLPNPNDQGKYSVLSVSEASQQKLVARSVTVNTNEDQEFTGQLEAVEGDGLGTLTFRLAQKPEHGKVEIESDGWYKYTPDENYNGQDAFTFYIATSTVDGIEDVVTNRPMPWEVVVSETDGSVYWIENANNIARVMRADADGSNVRGVTTLNNQGGSSNGSPVLDEMHGKIYFADLLNQTYQIWSVNMDGTARETLMLPASETGTVLDLKYDEVTNQLVWLSHSGIKTYDLDHPDEGVQTVIARPAVGDGLINSFAIGGGQIYWNTGIFDSSQPYASTYKFKRANLDGSAVITLASSVPPTAQMVVDAEREILYWTESGGQSIKKLVIGTETVTTLVEERNNTGIWDIDFHKGSNSLHWVDLGLTEPYRGGIKRIGLGVRSEPASVEINIAPVNDPPFVKKQPGDMILKEGGTRILTFEDVFLNVDEGPLTYRVIITDANGDIVLDQDDVETPYTFQGSPSGVFDVTLRATNLDGVFTETGFRLTVNEKPVAFAMTLNVDEDQKVIGQLAAEGPEPLTFHLDEAPEHGSVEIRLDGSYTYTPDENYNGEDNFTFHVESGHPEVITLDYQVPPQSAVLNEQDGKMYWVEKAGRFYYSYGKLMRSDADGTNIETVKSPLSDYSSEVTWDLSHGKIYYSTSNSIMSVNMNGTDLQALTATSIMGYRGDVRELEYDEESHQLFWLDVRNNLIRSLDLNNPGIEAKVAVPLKVNVGTPQQTSINSFAIHNGQLYWFAIPRDNRGKVKLMTADLNGANEKEILLDVPPLIGIMHVNAANNNAGLVVDSLTETLYWMDFVDGVKELKALVIGEKTVEKVWESKGWQSMEWLSINENGRYLYWTTLDGQESKSQRMDIRMRSRSDPTEVKINITPVNDVPYVKEALTDITLQEGRARSLEFENIFADADKEPLNFSVTVTDANGNTVKHETDVSARYDLSVPCCGVMTVTLSARDAAGDTASVVFVMTVEPAPKAFSLTVDMLEDKEFKGQLQGQGTEGFIFQLDSEPQHGKVVVKPDGSFTYTPDPNYHGEDRFTFVTRTNQEIPQKNVEIPGFISKRNSSPRSVVVDETKGVVYWMEAHRANGISTLAIMSANKNGSNIKMLYDEYARMEGMVLDTVRDILYFYHWNVSQQALEIMSMNVNGSNRQVVSSIPSIELPSDYRPLAFHAETNQLYWIKDGIVKKHDLNHPNNGIQDIAAAAEFGIDGDRIYWLMNDAFMSSDLDGGDVIVRELESDPAEVVMAISSVNDAPVVIRHFEDSVLKEGVTKTFVFEQIFRDVDGDELTYRIVVRDEEGEIVLDQDNVKSPYGFLGTCCGVMTVTLSAVDPDGASAETEFKIKVGNNSPVAETVTLTTEEGVTGRVYLTGSDKDGDPITFNIKKQPSHGTLSDIQSDILLDGTRRFFVDYTPEANYNGGDAFEYTAHDGEKESAPADVIIDITPVNSLPSLRFTGRNVELSDGEEYTLNIAELFEDIDGDPLTYGVVVKDKRGNILMEDQNAPSPYTFTGQCCGVVLVTLRATDPGGEFVETGFKITVKRDMEDKPVAFSLTKDMLEDGVAVGQLQGIGEGPLTFHLAQEPAHGSVIVESDGKYTYTPDENYNGVDTFTFYVTTGGNNGIDDVVPARLNPREVVVSETDGSIYWIENGTTLMRADSDGTYPKVIRKLGSSADAANLVLDAGHKKFYFSGGDCNPHSLCSVNMDGTALKPITITGDPGGITHLQYHAKTNQLFWSVAGNIWSYHLPTARSKLVVPWVADDGPGAAFAVGGDRLYWNTMGDNFVKIKSANLDGSDVRILADSVASAWNHWEMTVDVGGQALYWSDSDGSIKRLLIGEDRVEIVVEASENGTVSSLYFHQAGNNLYWTDEDGDSEDIERFDAALRSDPAAVNVNIAPVNDAPLAHPDAYLTGRNTALQVAADHGVLANDEDVDGDSLIALLVEGPANGTLTLNEDGSFFYMSNPGLNGTDSFTYKVRDPSGVESGVETVMITINDPPVTKSDAYSTDEDQRLTVHPNIGVLVNDSDADGDMFTAVLVAGPQRGTLRFNPDGSFDYMPEANFNGTDNFTYKAKDSNGLESGIETVTITVNSVNDAPVTTGDAYSIDENQSLMVMPGFGVLANDRDDDGDWLTAVLVEGPAVGMLTLRSDGSFDYMPEAEFNGSVSFKYKAKDQNGAESGIETVTITVNLVNSPPMAFEDAYSTEEDQSLTVPADIGVLMSDMDEDGDALTAVLLSVPAHGMLTFHADGSFIYIPSPGFNGEDSFEYKAVDSNGTESNAVTVTLTVNPGYIDPGQTYAEWVQEMEGAFSQYQQNHPEESSLNLLIGTEMDQMMMSYEGYTQVINLGNRLNDAGEEVFALGYKFGSDAMYAGIEDEAGSADGETPFEENGDSGWQTGPFDGASDEKLNDDNSTLADISTESGGNDFPRGDDVPLTIDTMADDNTMMTSPDDAFYADTMTDDATMTGMTVDTSAVDMMPPAMVAGDNGTAAGMQDSIMVESDIDTAAVGTTDAANDINDSTMTGMDDASMMDDSMWRMTGHPGDSTMKNTNEGNGTPSGGRR